MEEKTFDEFVELLEDVDNSYDLVDILYDMSEAHLTKAEQNVMFNKVLGVAIALREDGYE